MTAVPESAGNPTNAHTIASLDVPKGSYVISAKGVFYPGASTGQLFCTLRAGSSTDRTNDQFESQFDWLPLPLALTHRFTRPGRIRLNCTANGPGAEATDIQITAMQVSKLTKN